MSPLLTLPSWHRYFLLAHAVRVIILDEPGLSAHRSRDGVVGGAITNGNALHRSPRSGLLPQPPYPRFRFGPDVIRLRDAADSVVVENDGQGEPIGRDAADV